MKLIRFLLTSYIVTAVALFLYSYTQVDLSLTLSRQSIFQVIEKSFQYIGYFNRPLSATLFFAIISFFYVLYIAILKYVHLGKITRKQLWIVILISVGILTFSYNAFSYDFFNYIFYGKIITHYHQNPYFVKALDFPHDPMLSFMHWTQNTYPYGPFFLLLITPLSFLGFNLFIPTFFLFKIFTAVCLIGCFYFVEKILEKTFPKKVSFGLAFFALSPLTLVEGIVSAHNDVVMMFFALLGVYLLITRKRVLGMLSLLASWQTKEATAFMLIPSAIYFIITFFKKQLVTEKLYVRLAGAFMILAFVYLATFRELQPWYFLWILPLVITLTVQRYFLSLVVGLSFGLLLRYMPFLLQGNWDGNATQIKLLVTVVSPIIFILGMGFVDLIKFLLKSKKKQ